MMGNMGKQAETAEHQEMVARLKEVRAAAIEALGLLSLKGRIVTADALHTHQAMTQAIRQAGGHYVLALKGNKSTLAKAAGGLGAFVSGVVAVYGFLRLRQLRRFESYYQEIRRLELIARGQETDPAAPADPAARRAYLEERLLDLKCRALQDFANGGLRGEGLMSGIVSLVNDTRASLARLAPPAPLAPNNGAPPR